MSFADFREISLKCTDPSNNLDVIFCIPALSDSSVAVRLTYDVTVALAQFNILS
jgi:hypothetical protein